MKTTRYCVGIDLAREAKHEAIIYSQPQVGKGEKCKVFSFTHDVDGFNALSEHIFDVTGQNSLENVIVNMEPTSGVWRDVCKFFYQNKASVYYTRNDVVAELRKAHNRYVKTDAVDASVLSQIPWSLPQRLIPYIPREARIMKLRKLSDHRQRVVEETTRWKNRFRALLENFWKEFLVQIGLAACFSKSMMSFWEKYPYPEKLIKVGWKRFSKWYDKNMHGLSKDSLKEKIWNASETSVFLWDMLEKGQEEEELYGSILLLYTDILRKLKKELDSIDDLIKDARKEVPECDVVQAIPGVGSIVSVTIISTFMPLSRFSNTGKIAAYTGLVSRKKSSGKREQSGLRITKSGNRRLKRDLVLASDVTMHWDPQLADFATRLLKAGKHYNKVRVAVARKIAIRAYSLLKKYLGGDKDFVYEYRNLQGEIIDKKEARFLSQAIWSEYKSLKKSGSPQ